MRAGLDDVHSAQSRPRPGAAWLRAGTVHLHPRRNGLNLVRLLLAYTVLVAHGFPLSGLGEGPVVGGDNAGGWAVFGFFAISGYLITGSRLGNDVGTYVVHRVARIFPAFLVCLIATAFVFAPIGYIAQHGSLEGFLTTPTTPVNYVLSNLTLRMNTYTVAGTPGDVPYPGAWDGSLWSLYYEFLCYVIVGLLASIGFMRRSPIGLGAAYVASVVLWARLDFLGSYVENNFDLQMLARLLPFFLAGGLLFMLRRRLVLTWPLGLLALVASVASAVLIDGWGAQLAAPLLAYGFLCLGAVLPCPDFVRRNDVSYGIYIYAFPVQQLLMIAGAHAWPLAVFDLAAAVVVAPLAAASWFLVERPVMRRARRATAGLHAARRGTEPRLGAQHVDAPTDARDQHGEPQIPKVALPLPQ